MQIRFDNRHGHLFLSQYLCIWRRLETVFFPIGCMALTEIIQVFKILHCFPEIIFKSHHTPLITQTDCTVKQTKVLSMAPVMYKI